MDNFINFKELEGKTFSKIVISSDKDEMIFICNNGEVFKMYHEQDCCETVLVEEVHGNLDDLTEAPILMAEESTNSGETDWGSYTWTFYKLATNKGIVTIRWYGSSNGYYSERVTFIKVV